ncbi:MAG: TonB family protein [Deltaproteobacteria bacterium]|nr:TonB family protein [Deltaproteobacteria bacterium]
MPSQKILILSVAISVLAHALLISATGLLDRRLGKPKLETTITVNLQEAQEIRSELTHRNIEAKESPASEPTEATAGDDLGQETIALDSEDQRFAPYLQKIKQKIENIWSYPPEAFAEKKMGVSTVAFSLDSRGRLVASKIVKSSGHKTLDRGTINVIKAAAPYAPFPPEINLSRLHIQATFMYRFLQ